MGGRVFWRVDILGYNHGTKLSKGIRAAATYIVEFIYSHALTFFREGATMDFYL